MRDTTSGWTWVDLLSLVVAGVAVLIAFLGWRSDRWFRDRDGLAALLARFEAAHFHTVMWRVEQASRPEGRDSSAIEPFELGSHAAKKPIVQRALASDWGLDDAPMFDLYFFALRVHAWLGPAGWRLNRRRARLLNATFGYQLLVTFLDHRVIACRLRRTDEDETYFPTQYGCLDPVYQDLVTRLWNDMKSRTDTPPAAIRDALERRYDSTEKHLAVL